MDLDIETGPKAKSPDPKPEGLGEHLNGCVFVVVYFLLVCVAGVSGFACFLIVLGSGPAANTPEATSLAYWLCFTVSLVGLAICSRPQRR